ncbi:MAG TPA: hypothetical protein VGM67_13415 [Gemmatimonadaceae bacterium]|jgi:hypothetical protein
MRAIARTIILAAAVLTACGDGGADCLALPCPLPIALKLTVNSAATGAPITTASVAVTGGQLTIIPCNGTCFVPGGPGTYNITVTASGFTSVERSIHVTGSTPKCGCDSADLQDLTIALSASS